MPVLKNTSNYQRRPKAFGNVQIEYKRELPSKTILRRSENFRLLSEAMGGVLSFAAKAHINLARAGQILAQQDTIDDQLAEHMGRMLGIEPSWFDRENYEISQEMLDKIAAHKMDDDEEEEARPERPALTAPLNDLGKATTPMQVTAQVPVQIQPQSDLAPQPSAAPGASLNATVSALTDAPAPEAAPENTMASEDEYPLFASWLKAKIDGHPGLEKDVCIWLGIQTWRLKGWLGARRRIFRDDVVKLVENLTSHGYAWGSEVMGQYDKYVVHQKNMRGKDRSKMQMQKAPAFDQASSQTTIKKRGRPVGSGKNKTDMNASSPTPAADKLLSYLKQKTSQEQETVKGQSTPIYSEVPKMEDKGQNLEDTPQAENKAQPQTATVAVEVLEPTKVALEKREETMAEVVRTVAALNTTLISVLEVMKK